MRVGVHGRSYVLAIRLVTLGLWITGVVGGAKGGRAGGLVAGGAPSAGGAGDGRVIGLVADWPGKV